MDRNSVIGFTLLALLLVGYIFFNQQGKAELEEQNRADSVANAKVHPKPIEETQGDTTAETAGIVELVNDSLEQLKPAAYRGEEKKVILENGDIAVGFSTKGASPVSAVLKQYKTYDKGELVFFDGNQNKLGAVLPIDNGAVATSDLYYTTQEQTDENGYSSLVFTADLGEGKQVLITYTLPKEGYMLQCKMQLVGMSASSLPVTWQTVAKHTEKDINNERKNSQVYYRFVDKDEDYFTIANSDEPEKLEKATEWVGLKMHFFSTALIANDRFNNVTIESKASFEDNSVFVNNGEEPVAVNTTTLDAPLDASKSMGFRMYIGPNHYKTLRSFDIGLEEMVPLGYGPMFFVKYINKGLIIPIFNFLSKFISNYGVIIMLMTIIIRLLLSFFTYKSYLSAAKMRVLKPEIDELKAKYADDQQKFGVEQMKLYRSAGVNPLGGCLPTLFQLPILFAMFYFFPSSIELRQESFLWAKDLSTYDSIASWSANIPVLSSIYGNHISLFTILMTVSSLFLALYNRNMTAQDPNNPVMKYLPFIFPFMLLGVFNKMAAALTFYYFFSNMISIAQQFIIQKYVINEDAIHAKIQEKKNQPATQSKWQSKLEEMQKAQMERAKQQPRKKK